MNCAICGYKIETRVKRCSLVPLICRKCYRKASKARTSAERMRHRIAKAHQDKQKSNTCPSDEEIAIDITPMTLACQKANKRKLPVTQESRNRLKEASNLSFLIESGYER